MLFNSLEFGALLVVTLLAVALTRGRSRRIVLLVASWAFYAGWDPRFLPLLLFSTYLDYGVALAMPGASPGRRKALLAASLVGNLGVLVYFKYWAWFLANLGLGPWPGDQGFHVYGSVPPGLSFYTFQTLSYTIDVYRGRQAPCRSLLDFSLFVAFFPQLVAGPIVRAEEFLPQLQQDRPPDPQGTMQGVELFVLGLVKKVVIADNLGWMVDDVFADPRSYSGPALLAAGLMFGGQVYCDFSGYSTMARGLARILGFHLPRNFNYPLLAADPLEYRRGWHVTMSEWFRDYVFHPLGGTRHGPARTAINLMIVWALFGLWHGAAWTFAAWGLYNGVIQATYRELHRRGWLPPEFPGKRYAGMALNLLLVASSAVLFRSASGADMLDSLLRIGTVARGAFLPTYAWVTGVCLFAVHALSKATYDENLLWRSSWPTRWALLVGAVLLVLVAAPTGRPFVYFQF